MSEAEKPAGAVDKILNCQSCKQDFIFSVAEQLFFARKGFDKLPKKCPSCRKQQKDKDRHRPQSSHQRSEFRAGRKPAAATVQTCSLCGGAAELFHRLPPGRPLFCAFCYEWRQRNDADRFPTLPAAAKENK